MKDPYYPSAIAYSPSSPSLRISHSPYFIFPLFIHVAGSIDASHISTLQHNRLSNVSSPIISDISRHTERIRHLVLRPYVPCYMLLGQEELTAALL